MIEETLVFIKPPHSTDSKKCEDIFGFLENKLGGGFIRSIGPFYFHPSKELICEHYAHIPQEMISQYALQMTENGIVLAIYSGENIIQRVRGVIGPTDPQKAGGRLRGYFSIDSLDVALSQGRPVDNVIHASGNVEEAEIEKRRFFDFLAEKFS